MQPWVRQFQLSLLNSTDLISDDVRDSHEGFPADGHVNEQNTQNTLYIYISVITAKALHYAMGFPKNVMEYAAGYLCKFYAMKFYEFAKIVGAGKKKYLEIFQHLLWSMTRVICSHSATFFLFSLFLHKPMKWRDLTMFPAAAPSSCVK